MIVDGLYPSFKMCISRLYTNTLQGLRADGKAALTQHNNIATIYRVNVIKGTWYTITWPHLSVPARVPTPIEAN